MAIIRNTASMMLKGKIGATTYYVAETRQLARQAMNNSNYGESASRTDLQQGRRVKWANLVNFYSANKSWMKKAYEDLKPGVSIFNRFMQLNINGATIPLTRDQAQTKTWVASSYRLTQGSLTPLTLGAGDGANAVVVNNINVAQGDVQESTLGAFSQALINSPAGFADGDALVIVEFFGTVSAPGSANVFPASFNYMEIVLNSSSSESFNNADGKFSVSGGHLNYDPMNERVVGVVFIHTRKASGKLLVSTQDLYLMQEPTAAWTESAQLTEAIKSYGESETVPLNPGGTLTVIGGGGSSGGGGGSEGDGDLGD